MTEAEWLACDDPEAMLRCLLHEGRYPSPTRETPPLPPASDRKLRLFACACIRRRADRRPPPGEDVIYVPRSGHRLREFASRCVRNSDVQGYFDLDAVERYADDGSGSWPSVRLDGRPVDPVTAAVLCLSPLELAQAVAPPAAEDHLPQREKAALLRDLVGNPWRPVRRGWVHQGDFIPHLAPGWACSHAALNLARALYDGRDWAALPVLADALEEAGCPEEEPCTECGGRGYWHTHVHHPCSECNGIGRVRNPLLAHCRGPGPHARGCWALDLVLGLG